MKKKKISFPLLIKYIILYFSFSKSQKFLSPKKFKRKFIYFFGFSNLKIENSQIKSTIKLPRFAIRNTLNFFEF